MVKQTAIVCRVGRKRPIRDVILRKAPKDFTTYVEPFVGSGDIYYYMGLDPSVKAVINDLDPMIAQSHKIIKSNPSIENIQKYKMSLAESQAFVNKSHSSPLDKLAKNLMLLCGTFGGYTGRDKLAKTVGVAEKMKKIPAIAEYMANTTITQQDYKTVFKNHDSAGTFTYLDPPYEDSDKLYAKSAIDFEEMARLIKSAKGKVMLSINDSPNIREIFKGLNISKVSVRGGGATGTSGIGKKERAELIITNY